MAYPTVSAPYGLKPVNSLDGKPYAGAIRQIPVAAGFATAIFNGDVVELDSTGYLIKSTATNSGTIVGVVVGGQYVNYSGQTVQGQYIPAAASTASNLAYAYVVDDPMALFKVAVVSSGTTSITRIGIVAVVPAPVKVTAKALSPVVVEPAFKTKGTLEPTSARLAVPIVVPLVTTATLNRACWSSTT